MTKATWRCGHPRTPENTNRGGTGRCRICFNAYERQWHKDNPDSHRRRYLKTQLPYVRRKLAALEAEAARYGMTELLEPRA